VLFYDGRADLPCGLDFLTGVGEAVRDYCLGAIGIRDDLLRRKDGGVIKFFVVGPVGAAVGAGC